MRHSARVILRRTLIHGAIGLALATLVAQAAALFADTDVDAAIALDGGVFHAYDVAPGLEVEWRESYGPGRTRLWWRFSEIAAHWRAGQGAVMPRANVTPRHADQPPPPPWSRLARDPQSLAGRAVDDLGFGGDNIDRAVGWPVRAFSFGMRRVRDLNPGLFGKPYRPEGLAWDFYPSGLLAPRTLHREPRFISLNPIWAGLIVSSAFWGVLSFAGWTVARSAWSHTRTLRRLCPKCRYDLRGLPEGAVCPECGGP